MTDIQSELNAYRGRYFEGEWPTIYQMFAISLSRFPSRPCFTVFEPNRKTYTYSDVDKHIKAIAAKLIEAGVQPGEKVVINGTNSVQSAAPGYSSGMTDNGANAIGWSRIR